MNPKNILSLLKKHFSASLLNYENLNSPITSEEIRLSEVIVSMIESDDPNSYTDLDFCLPEDNVEEEYLPEDEKPPRPGHYKPKYNDIQNQDIVDRFFGEGRYQSRHKFTTIQSQYRLLVDPREIYR